MHKWAFNLLIVTAPLMNFSIVADSNLPLAYILTLLIALAMFVFTKTLPAQAFGKEDYFYALFLIWGILSFLVNSSEFPGYKGLHQVINLFLTYLIFKISLILLFKSGRNPEELLRKIFKINTFYCFVAIVLFWVTFLYGSLVDEQLLFFNNSGNFTLTNFSHDLKTARSFGFGPEPSFWSFFVALNISLGLIIKNPGRLLLSINVINLILTFGRTGLLITLVILVIKFTNVSFLRKAFVIFLLIIGFIVFYDQFNFTSLKSVDSSFNERFDSVIVSAELTFNNLIFGIGLGNFAEQAKAYKLSYRDIFNLFLSIIVSCGAVGFTSFMLSLYSIFKRIGPALKLPFYASIVGWMTVSAYNLSFIWIILAALIYHSKFNYEQSLIKRNLILTSTQ